MSKFNIRRSPVDGMHRKWELKMASEVQGLGASPYALDALPGEDPRRVRPGWFDYEVWVCTGVFKTRGAAFRSA